VRNNEISGYFINLCWAYRIKMQEKFDYQYNGEFPIQDFGENYGYYLTVKKKMAMHLAWLCCSNICYLFVVSSRQRETLSAKAHIYVYSLFG
jgi:hypothetical protein